MSALLNLPTAPALSTGGPGSGVTHRSEQDLSDLRRLLAFVEQRRAALPPQCSARADAEALLAKLQQGLLLAGNARAYPDPANEEAPNLEHLRRRALVDAQT